MLAFDNTAVAAKLELTARLLELSGADKFRFLSYRKAASAIRAYPEQVSVLAAHDRLAEVPGVGAKMADNIRQLLDHGSFEALDTLTVRIPASLADVMQVPGVGPRRAMQLHEKLGVASVDDLAEALSQERVAALGGFGAKTAEKIASSLDSFLRHRERTPLAVSLPVSESLLRDMRGLASLEQVEVAGSVRRREDTTGNIDLVVAAPTFAAVIDDVVRLAAVERVIERGDDSVVFELHDGIEVAVHIASPERFSAALRYFTGSVAHNTQLAEKAAASGVDVSPNAIAGSESEIYERLGMQTPPPEIRWGADEIDLAEKHDLPRLVQLEDVRADLQSHSTYTDGKSTLEANRSVAAELGYEYFAATDHAYNLRMVGGLDVAGLERQWVEIDELNLQAEQQGLPMILKGIELNIAEDGSLDYDDDILARFDIVLASMHSGWEDDEATATARAIKAIEHPLVDIIAHPTGRILGRRDPIPVNVDAMLEAAAETGTIMEINSYPDRLDLSASHVRQGRARGVRFSIGTDAHACEQMRYMPYGVGQARRGMLTIDDLLNAQPWQIARTWLKRRRVLDD